MTSPLDEPFDPTLDPLNFVVDVFNKKIHPKLKLRTNLFPDSVKIDEIGRGDGNFDNTPVPTNPDSLDLSDPKYRNDYSYMFNTNHPRLSGSDDPNNPDDLESGVRFPHAASAAVIDGQELEKGFQGSIQYTNEGSQVNPIFIAGQRVSFGDSPTLYTIGSIVPDESIALRECLIENIADGAHIRRSISLGDIYRFTPPPDPNPNNLIGEWVWESNPFGREVLCLPGLAVNDYNTLPSVATDEEYDYWALARITNRDNLTMLRGVKERAAVIVIAMGIDVSKMFLSGRMYSPMLPELVRLSVRKRAYKILEFLEKESLKQFSKYNRLVDQISMTDDFANQQALRRFVVLIRA